MTHIIAIFFASIASMIFGALWYSPKVFGEKPQPIDPTLDPSASQKPRDTKRFAGSFLLQIITALTLLVIMQKLDISNMFGALEVGTLLWFGFLMPWEANLVLWQGKSWKQFLVGTLHHLSSLLLTAFVISLFL